MLEKICIISTNIQILLDVSTEKFHYSLAAENKESEQKVRALLEMEDHGVAQYQDILQDIITLYQDPSIQKCLEQKAKFYVSPILLSLHTSPIPPSCQIRLPIF